MAVTEEERHELHSWLERQAGSKVAATLMKHLPPVGWMDVTTNTELDHARGDLGARIDRVETDLGARIDRVEHGLDRVELTLRTELADRIERQTRVLVFGLVAALGAYTSVTLAAVRFMG